MTKNEYLIELAKRIQALAKDHIEVHEELRAMLEFYQEIIEGKMEDGMTEEEAVAAMEPIDAIVERFKNEPGCGENGSSGPDNDPESTGDAARHEYDPDAVTLVRVRDSDHGIRLVRGERAALSYENDPNGKYEVSLEDGVLTLRFIRERGGIFRRFFGWRARSGAVTVELPDGWKGAADIRTSNAAIFASVGIDSLTVRTSNGAITFEEVSARELRGGTSNGAIRFEDADCGKVDLETSNCRIVVGGVSCDRAKLVSSNASVSVSDATAGEMLLESSNSYVQVREFTGGKLEARTGNGPIRLEGVNASDITLITSNGSITGSVIGKMEDFAITSKNSNGSNNLPDGTRGEKKLEARASNGRIEVEFTV